MTQGGETTPERPFGIERVDFEDGHSEVRFRGTLTFPDAVTVWTDVRELIEHSPNRHVDFDLNGVDRIDGGTMALLVQLNCELEAQGTKSQFEGASGTVAEILDLYTGEQKPCLREAPGRQGILQQVGQVTLGLVDEVKLVLSFLGALVLLSGWASLKNPGSVNWRDVPRIMERAGADGLPIVVLINFLVGFIMGFQGAVQLKQFGANILVADLVGLSITRELGPLMTAIIVCGRSGASFAAELGTMKVSEEVDALQTMGFDPLRYLVFPRVIALILVLPLLTLIADLVGIVGGLLVGIISLDLTVLAYWNQTLLALDLWDVFSGALKSLVFAGAIAFIACQQGLATSGGAQGVGRRTTSSVVSILFALILIDALFTVLFYMFGV